MPARSGSRRCVCTVVRSRTPLTLLDAGSPGSLYLAAAVTRLAFYNVTHDDVHGFIGLPAPVAALVWSSALCVTGSRLALAAVLVGAAVAMIAPWRHPRARPAPRLAGLRALAGCVVGLLHFAYP